MKKTLILFVFFLGIIIPSSNFVFANCRTETYWIDPINTTIDPIDASPGEIIYVGVSAQSQSGDPSNCGMYSYRVRMNYDYENSTDWIMVQSNTTVAGYFNLPNIGSTFYSDDLPHTIAIEVCYLKPGVGYSLEGFDNPAIAVCQTVTRIVNQVTPILCGNGIVETSSDPSLNEECDGSVGLSCLDFGFNTGNVICTADCKIDSSGCTNTIIEPTIPTRYPNPLIWETILNFLEFFVVYLFWIGSSLVLLMILVGAVMITTSAGSPIRVDKGKRTIMWAIIGFVVIVGVNGIIALLKAVFSVK